MSANIILLIIALVLSGIFIIILLTGSKYDIMVENLEEKEYPAHELYVFGFKLLEIIRFTYKSEKALERRKEAIVLYGEKYGDYYFRVLYAQKVTLSYLIGLIIIIMGTFVKDSSGYVIAVLGVVMAVTVYIYYDKLCKENLKKKSEKYLSEFPNAISSITLLVNAGMILREAWEMVSNSGSGELYQQMQRVNEDIRNGISEIDALYAFSDRCATPEIRKFTSMIVQGIEKGNRELAITLKKLSEELWHTRKQYVLQQGELAASKLLIPIMMMFVGIVIMIVGPLVTNIGI